MTSNSSTPRRSSGSRKGGGLGNSVPTIVSPPLIGFGQHFLALAAWLLGGRQRSAPSWRTCANERYGGTQMRCRTVRRLNGPLPGCETCGRHTRLSPSPARGCGGIGVRTAHCRSGAGRGAATVSRGRPRDGPLLSRNNLCQRPADGLREGYAQGGGWRPVLYRLADGQLACGPPQVGERSGQNRGGRVGGAQKLAERLDIGPTAPRSAPVSLSLD